MVLMKKQNFFTSSLILLISAAAAKVLGALFKIPLTNLLGGVGMSYFSCAYSLFLPVYALTVTGLSSAVAKLTAQSIALDMPENAVRVRRTALSLFSAAGAVGSILVIALARPFCIYATGIKEAETAVLMIAPSVLFGCITAVERGYFEGLSNMYPTAFSQLAEGIVKVGMGLFLCSYATKHGDALMRYFPRCTDIRALAAAAGILGVTLSSLGALIVLRLFLLFRRREKLPKGTPVMSRREIVRELIRTALPTGASSLVTNLTALIDMGTVIGCITLFSGNMTLPSDIPKSELPHFVYGSYAGIALTVFNLVPSVTNMLGKGILPTITEAWSKGDRDALAKSTMQAISTSLLIAIPCAVGIGLLSHEVLTFLFPRQSDEVALCASSLRLLMPGMVCLCVSYPIFSMLQAIGKPSAPLRIMMLGAVLKLIGNVTLIPFIGVDGAALSTTICYIFIAATALICYFKAAKLRPSFSSAAAVLYSGAMCGASAYIARTISSCRADSAFAVIAFSGIVGGAVYLTLTAMLRDTIFGYKQGSSHA